MTQVVVELGTACVAAQPFGIGMQRRGWERGDYGAAASIARMDR